MVAASGRPLLSETAFLRSQGLLRELSFDRSKTGHGLKRRRESRIGRVDLKFSPGSFARRLHTGEHALDIGHGRVERGERRAGAGFNGSAFTLGRQRGTARAGQEAKIVEPDAAPAQAPAKAASAAGAR